MLCVSLMDEAMVYGTFMYFRVVDNNRNSFCFSGSSSETGNAGVHAGKCPRLLSVYSLFETI